MAFPAMAQDQPDIGDAAYTGGLLWLNQKIPGITGILPFNMLKVAAEHGPNAPFLEGPLGEHWADPFWDDAGWAIAKDSANLGDALPLSGSPLGFFFDSAKFLLIVAENNKQALIEWEDKSGLTDFYLSVLPHEPLEEPSSSGPAAALSALGIGTPQLSPSDSSVSWGFEGTDVPETSGGGTYFDEANDVWYIDAFEWQGDRGLYDKPAAPRRFVSGELNTYGYNWIYLPFERTGLTYDQGYYDWAAETLASMGMAGPTAGYGTLM